MQAHPAAKIVPEMTPKEFGDLIEDIRENGQQLPIILHEGMILDGRHRFRACEQLGIEPKLEEWTGHGHPEVFVASMNAKRRNLSESQLAMIGAELARLKVGDVASQINGPPHGGPSPLSAAAAAAIVGASSRTVERAKRVLNDGTPEEIDAIKKGEATVATTERKIRARKSAPPAPKPPPQPSRQALTPRIVVPEGATVESMCREIMRRVNGGESPEDAAPAFNIGVVTFRRARDIMQLAENPNLSESDRARTQAALAEMNGQRIIDRPFQAVADIARRVWGDRKGPREKAQARRIDAFEGAMGAITQMCTQLQEFDVPYLSKEQATEAAAELAQAINSLKGFRSRVMEMCK